MAWRNDPPIRIMSGFRPAAIAVIVVFSVVGPLNPEATDLDGLTGGSPKRLAT